MRDAIEDQPHTLADVRARVSQLRETARAMVQQAELLATAIERFEVAKPALAPLPELPERAKVKIVEGVADAPEVTGRTGVALAGGATEEGWTYTVLVDGLDETYILPRSALQYLGETVPADHLYPGASLRVRVDDRGAGTVVKRRSGKRSGRT